MPRSRIVRSSSALLALVVLGLLALAGCGQTVQEAGNQGEPVTARADPTSRVGDRAEVSDLSFTPAAFREGKVVVLPVVFPDGTRAELVYPPELDIAGLGVRPYTSGTLHGNSPTKPLRSDFVGRDFRVFYGELKDVLPVIGGGSPVLLSTYKEADGQSVGFWHLPADRDVDHLAFQFGRWAVLVYDYAAAGLAGAWMTEAERASRAASFRGRETANGFLLLEGSGPLRLARVGERAGPELGFGTAVEPERGFSLHPGSCRPHRDQTRLVRGKLVQWNGGFADWCASDSMRVHATGPDEFIAALIGDLDVRNVDLASS